MSRVQRFLANPYKTKALARRLFRGVRQWVVVRHLARVRPETLPRYLQPGTATARYFRTRIQPSFFFDATRIPAILTATPEERKKCLVRDAQQVLARTFTFRGLAPVSFADAIDWRFVAGNDQDWNADLHRLDWVVVLLLAAHYTNEGTFAEHAAVVVTHWWRSNLPGSLPWHDPFEVAQRANTLSWILSLGAPLPAFSDEALYSALCALLTSGRWVETTLEYHVPNNHLLIQALRLFQLGLLFPEFFWARRWMRQGLRLLEREITRQVLPDGVHAERSVFYQRLVLEALLELIALTARNSLPLPALMYNRARRMLSFLHGIRRPDGEFPLLGDGFHDDILLRYNLAVAGAELLGTDHDGSQPDERTLWLLNGHWPLPPPSTSASAVQLWTHGGYAAVKRRGVAGSSQLVFDFGEFGMAAAPGHGHADCLSLELSVSGHPFLIDPGTYSWYRGEHWRNAFRSTRAHNTVVVDGRDQTPLHGAFGAGHLAIPSLNTALLGDRLRLFDASHDGYHRLSGKVTHRRIIVDIRHSGWLVIDSLTGQGRHGIEVLWHFHPTIALTLAGASCRAREQSGSSLSMGWSASAEFQSQIYHGQENPPLGWVSFEAGKKEPGDVLVLSASCSLPVWIGTFLTCGEGLTSRPRLSRLPCYEGFALNYEKENIATSVFLAAERMSGGTFAEWSTDAATVVISTTPTEQTFLLVGGSWLKQSGEERIRLSATSQGVIMTAAHEQLTIHGDVQCPLFFRGQPVRQALINGREARVSANDNHITRVES